MPRSKRSKIVSLTKVAKKGREHKNALLQEVQENADKWQYCWLFEVGNMRNSHLKTVRKLWKDSARIFFGRGALAAHIKGQVGLLFTDSPPAEVRAWFADFRQADFARAGNVAARTVVLPAGPVLQRHADPPEPFPHSEEPQLRRLGLRTRMERGVPTLDVPHTVCEAGKTLAAEQTQLLKLVGERLVTFRVGLRMWWAAETGEVTEEAQEPEEADAEAVEGEDGDGDGDGDEEMSE
ncbi:uncharacterized protein BXZ73DRAFT_89842 [Epithele typhae]|uniref:uncharacterized protein n=1 Tax=Epithele typhae TaxID=378194 RepID=UPI002007E7BC|nr:uncharacterized protein BXZ73DRAFT_89842 [Epithele typhae]KAH9933205.1 hypothetical protein BXZ73DRAFT_89842 [Epithele typhae]